jgi:hypothetical protein
MQIFFGLVLGVILTMVGAYAYDSSMGRTANGLSPTAADGHAPLVNWDVVDEDWTEFQAKVQDTAADFEKSLKRHTG